jgi:DivIVA domain-containing protein
MAMTPDDIRSPRFGVRLLRGLRPDEVSAFLEDVAEAYGDVQKWNAELLTRVQMLENEIQALKGREKETSASTHIETLRTAALREVEALLHDAQARAQMLIDGAKESEAVMLREAEAAKARMQIEAEEHVARATGQAELLIMTARQQEAALRSEIDRLAQSRLQLVDDIRAALDAYQQWLMTVDPRGRARGRREPLEMSNGDDESVSASDEVRAG